jgi:hypothetical protein
LRQSALAARSYLGFDRDWLAVVTWVVDAMFIPIRRGIAIANISKREVIVWETVIKQLDALLCCALGCSTSNRSENEFNVYRLSLNKSTRIIWAFKSEANELEASRLIHYTGESKHKSRSILICATNARVREGDCVFSRYSVMR